MGSDIYFLHCYRIRPVYVALVWGVPSEKQGVEKNKLLLKMVAQVPTRSIWRHRKERKGKARIYHDSKLRMGGNTADSANLVKSSTLSSLNGSVVFLNDRTTLMLHIKGAF